MKISTATSVFVNYAIEDVIDEIIQAGFDGIDIWCGRPHLYRKDYPPKVLLGLRHRLAQVGLTPVSFLPAFFRYPFSLSSPNAIIRQESVSYIKDTIDNACTLGASFVLVVPTHSLHGQSIKNARKWFMEDLSLLCDYAETRRMKLGIEVVYPNFSDYMNSTRDALKVIQEIGSSYLGIVLDSGHLNLSGENLEQAICNAGDLLFQVHVNDNDASHQQNSIPGEGCFDFPRLVQLLRKYQYDGYLAVEIGWQYSFDPVPAVTQALNRMRTYLTYR